MFKQRKQTGLLYLNEKENPLWIGFIEGDNSCFEKIYKDYIDVLFRYGIQFTQDEDVVKDAIHDVFIHIYGSRKTLKTDVNIKFYLFTALKNRLYNTFKREMFFEKLADQELVEILDHSAEYNILSPLEQEASRQRVKYLMDQLTDRQREAIYYRFVEELSMEEIGALLKINPQSVQNLIQRSLKIMRNPQILFFILLTLLFRSSNLCF